MNRYVAVSTILTVGIFAVLPGPAIAAVEWTSVASLSGGTVRLRAVTFNSSPNDRGVVRTMGARGNPFTGPGYSVVGAWHDQPLDADIVVVVAERFDTGAGTHCVTGGHRWLSSNGVTSIRASAQKCATKSSGGGCGIANPETSILSISGEQATLPVASLSPLTRRGVAEDARAIVLDEYALVHIGSPHASFQHVSENFQATPSLVNALMSQVDSGPVAVPGRAVVPLQAAAGNGVNPEGSPGPDATQARSGSVAALVIQHQREHPANERFAPVPHITFAPQVLAGSPPAHERKGFAIVDFGESGSTLRVDAISASGAPAESAIVTAISGAVSTQFSDDRRHDHRVYLAYEIDGGVLRAVGSPLVTMPQCCGPPIGCPPYPYQCY